MKHVRWRDKKEEEDKKNMTAKGKTARSLPLKYEEMCSIERRYDRLQRKGQRTEEPNWAAKSIMNSSTDNDRKRVSKEGK